MKHILPLLFLCLTGCSATTEEVKQPSPAPEYWAHSIEAPITKEVAKSHILFVATCAGPDDEACYFSATYTCKEEFWPDRTMKEITETNPQNGVWHLIYTCENKQSQ